MHHLAPTTEVPEIVTVSQVPTCTHATLHTNNARLKMLKREQRSVSIARHVAAFDIAGLAQAVTERFPQVGPVVLSEGGQKADDRQLRLLRTHCERPRRRRATDNTDKFPPSHVRRHAQDQTSYRLKRVL